MVLHSPAVTRREELVDVALVVLERDGFTRLSIGEIARLADIKPPSLYKQFDSKADIEAALIELGFRMLARDIETTIGSLADDAAAHDWARALAATLRAFGHAHPQLYQLMHSRPHSSGTPDATAIVRELIPGSVNASTVWAWAHGLLSLELIGALPSDDIDDAWKLLVDSVAEHTQRRDDETAGNTP